MNCLKCNHRNPATVAYCGKCGAKMDFTADEIAGSLVEKAREETAANTGHYARHTLTLGAVLFLVALTLFVLSLGAPEEAYYLPAFCRGSKHTKVEFRIEPDLQKLAIPLDIRKR